MPLKQQANSDSAKKMMASGTTNSNRSPSKGALAKSNSTKSALRMAILIALGALSSGRFATAQNSVGQNSESAAPETPAPEEESVSAGAVRRRANLSGAEQVSEAEQILQRGQSLSQRVLSMLDEARRDGDVLRVTCVDSSLTQINAHLATLDRRIRDLRTASETGDESRRNHEFTVVSVVGQNLEQLDRAANECVGQDLFDTGTTRITTTIDPNTTVVNPAQVSNPAPDPVPFIPPPASV